MQLLPVQEFYKSPRTAISSLSRKGKVVLTHRGKPSVFLIKTNSKNFERLCEQLQQMEALQAIDEMHEISEKNGNSKMSLKEINELIADVRKSK
ncbi:MAG: hypothetical protein FWB90_04005 [Fibromonadales bacterium]|nr:hypothetical protein [Fibromonadales bacterium]